MPQPAETTSRFPWKWFLIGILASVVIRSVTGLPDFILGHQIGLGAGGFTLSLGIFDVLIGVAAALAGKIMQALEPTAAGSGPPPEELVARRQVQIGRWYRGLGGLVFGLAFLAGLFILRAGYRDTMTGRQSRNWPTTPGHITASSVSFTSRQDRIEIDSRTPGETRTVTRETFFADIQYEYEVNSRSWTGNRVTIADVGCNSDDAHALAAQYPVGKSVSVYYDPQDPTSSVLVPGASTGSIVPLVLGPLWCVACAVALKVLVFSNFANNLIRELAVSGRPWRQ
ncbi:MAG: DUF3592 domain-containing protein [Planctomycetes bacterium]|nr:DUF3592 domain-containing protein [Planctomycetota bacterium]